VAKLYASLRCGRCRCDLITGRDLDKGGFAPQLSARANKRATRMRQSLFPFFVVLLAGATAITGCSPAAPPSVPALPAASEVDRITVRLHGPGVAGAYVGSSIEEFEIADQYIPAVMRALDEPRYVKHPRHVSEVGSLTIHC